jgi:hypothetical protein
MTGRGEFISAAAHLSQVDVLGRHQPVVADQHSLAVNLRLSSVAGNIAERSGDKFCYSGFVGATRGLSWSHSSVARPHFWCGWQSAGQSPRHCCSRSLS